MVYRVYRVIRFVKQGYALGVFWLYFAMFVLAVSLLWFPPLALGLVFVGLGGLVVAVLVGLLLGLVRDGLARLLASQGVCTSCGVRRLSIHDGAETCVRCGAAFGTAVSVDVSSA
jgi:hypothetical protein